MQVQIGHHRCLAPTSFGGAAALNKHNQLRHTRYIPTAATTPSSRAETDPSTSNSNAKQQQVAFFQQRFVAPALGALAAASLLIAAPSMAADNAKIGACVLGKCQKALAECLADVPCFENLVCLQLCNGSPDETSCQIKCGDKYDDKAIGVFNTCAVSEQKCVPQKQDEGLYPIPPDCALDAKFNLADFQGRWYITAGLNPLFDAFPCQEHFFTSPSPGVLYGKINWRIPQSNGDFVERSTMQRFVQQENPSILLNHDNEYLHYQDDWYIIGSKKDEYVFIYYRGENDAWKGYGGATVYTRSSTLSPELIPELRQLATNAGLKWDEFIITDNTCGPHPPKKDLVQEIEEEVVQAERFAVTAEKKLEKKIEPSLTSFGRGFTVLERGAEEVAAELVKDIEMEEETVAKELREEAEIAAKAIARFEFEASTSPWVKSLPEPLRQFFMPRP